MPGARQRKGAGGQAEVGDMESAEPGLPIALSLLT
jgi:hypothetical protein